MADNVQQGATVIGFQPPPGMHGYATVTVWAVSWREYYDMRRTLCDAGHSISEREISGAVVGGDAPVSVIAWWEGEVRCSMHSPALPAPVVDAEIVDDVPAGAVG